MTPGKNKKRFLIFGILIFLLLVVLFTFYFFPVSGSLKYCGDGTEHGVCSSENFRYLCTRGELIERADLCGCLENFKVLGSDCFSKLHYDTKLVKLNLAGKIKKEI